MRQKGTLINFVNDGDITRSDVNRLIQTGKIPVGKERTQIVERAQLERWGILRGQ